MKRLGIIGTALGSATTRNYLRDKLRRNRLSAVRELKTVAIIFLETGISNVMLATRHCHSHQQCASLARLLLESASEVGPYAIAFAGRLDGLGKDIMHSLCACATLWRQ